MNWKAIAIAFAAVLALAGCGSSGDGREADKDAHLAEAAEKGEQHVIDTARNVGYDGDPDEVLIRLARQTCQLLEQGSDFDFLVRSIQQATDDHGEIIQLLAITHSGIPAFCPEWFDASIEWMEEQEDS